MSDAPRHLGEAVYETAAQAIAQASALLGRLSPREQRLVAVFGALLVGALAYTLAIEPLGAGHARLTREIGTRTRDLAAMRQLAAYIRTSETTAKQRPQRDSADVDFSLFAFVDRVTSASVRPESVASMNPSRRVLEGGLAESTVEVKLSDVSLTEVVTVLREIDEASHPVYVKRLDLEKRYDDDERFDVTLLAAARSRS